MRRWGPWRGRGQNAGSGGASCQLRSAPAYAAGWWCDSGLRALAPGPSPCRWRRSRENLQGWERMGFNLKEAGDCREEAWGSHTGRRLTKGTMALQEAPASGSVGSRGGLGAPCPSCQVGPFGWLWSSITDWKRT